MQVLYSGGPGLSVNCPQARPTTLSERATDTMPAKRKRTQPSSQRPKLTVDNVPAPGLQGGYEEACVICLRGTDSGIGVEGEAEAHLAFLVALGVPEDEAYNTYRAMNPDLEPGNVRSGRSVVIFRLCSECAARPDPARPVPVGLLTPGRSVPTITLG